MSDPTTTNATATDVNTGINAVAAGVEAAVEADAETAVPALALPVVKQLFQALIGWIGGFFSKEIQESATDGVIDVQTTAQDNAVTIALATLKTAQASGNALEIVNAEKAYTNAVTALGAFNGAAPPQ